MCRFLAYIGAPMLLDEVLTQQSNSLVAQAMAAREAKTEVNADGCGFGWYGERRTPGLYRSILPAWSDPNLLGLMGQIRSKIFMAHVRSATSGDVSYANCHPFAHEGWLFMHNGMITSYRQMRGRIEDLIDEVMYENCKGSTDSEALFHIALSKGLAGDPIPAVERTLADVTEILRGRPSLERLRFAAALSDGERLWGFRWASDNRSPTLYHREVETGIVLASEPFDEEPQAWTAVPENAAICLSLDGAISVTPLTVAAAGASKPLERLAPEPSSPASSMAG